MNFYIRKNSTLPKLTVEVFIDDENSFWSSNDDFSASTITFNMKSEETGFYTIINKPVSVKVKRSTNSGPIKSYYLETQFTQKETAQKSWDQHGIVIIVKDLSDTVPLIDQLAPEHLELAVEEADQLAAQVRNAGSIFIGRNTPEAVGDYIAGPNHVLPTARSARFSSGLGVLDFMKRSTFVKCDEASLKTIGSEIITLAEAEGLDAHARSVSIRLKQKN